MSSAPRTDKKSREARIRQSWEEHYGELASGLVTMAEILGHPDQKLIDLADRGLRLLKVGKLDQARKILEALPLLDPYVPYFRYLLGMFYERTQQPGDADTEYDEAIALCRSTQPVAALLPFVLLAKAKLHMRYDKFEVAGPLLQQLSSPEHRGLDPRFQREVATLLRRVQAGGAGPAPA